MFPVVFSLPSPPLLVSSTSPPPSSSHGLAGRTSTARSNALRTTPLDGHSRYEFPHYMEKETNAVQSLISSRRLLSSPRRFPSLVMEMDAHRQGEFSVPSPTVSPSLLLLLSLNQKRDQIWEE
ncbi:hypothetical protein PENTCL1PPCAC_2058 [Pristionchus entomophagus]|uniref:Uncharacterized protein n=1 Tax=Pristionchus entomophagus TaxID=358040 RepID=A0AAV5SCG8_9BILA|nr:hypothetical protein PENTCL1PPCAC_2058 [Pristionchus entomophagus]